MYTHSPTHPHTHTLTGVLATACGAPAVHALHQAIALACVGNDTTNTTSKTTTTTQAEGLLVDFFASRALRRVLLSAGAPAVEGEGPSQDAQVAAQFANALWSVCLKGQCAR